MDSRERKKFEVLRELGLPAMPEPLDKVEGVWLYALAEITTRIGSRGYAVVRNNPGHSPEVIRVFDQNGVARIDAVYPYQMCNDSYAPKAGESGVASWVAKKYEVPVAKVNAAGKEKIEILRQKFIVDQELSKIRTKIRNEKNLEKAREAKKQKQENKNSDERGSD